MPARSGTRSQLKVNELSTSCIVHGALSDQIFEFEVSYDVTLELLFWSQFKHATHVGMPIQLAEGSRTVGRGIILDIVEL